MATRSEFLEQVARVVRARFPLVKVRQDVEDFSITVNGFSMSLENLYRSTAQNPESFQTLVEQWVLELLRMAEGTPDQKAPFEQLKSRIMPMVISAGRRDVAGQSMVTQDLLEGLRVAYAVDSPRTIAYVPRRVFAEWKISIDELHEIAIENLVARSQELPAHAAQNEDGAIGFIIIQTHDGYDASRILLPGLHDRLREHLGSPFLAGIPNRDILICMRDEPETVERIATRMRQDFKTMPHQISPRLFLITADGIALYEESGGLE